MYWVLVDQTSVIFISLLDSSVESFALATSILVSLIGHSQAQFHHLPWMFLQFLPCAMLPKNGESLLSFDMTLHLCTSREGLSIKHVDLYNLHPYSVYSN